MALGRAASCCGVSSPGGVVTSGIWANRRWRRLTPARTPRPPSKGHVFSWPTPQHRSRRTDASCSIAAYTTILRLIDHIVGQRTIVSPVDPGPTLPQRLSTTDEPRSRRGPGVRRCALPDSSPGPCAPAWSWSPACLLRPPRRPRSRISARPRPASSAPRIASTAGSSASSMVLSPSAALPRCWRPSTPAWNSATTSAGASSDLPAQAAAGAEKKCAQERPGSAAHRADEDRRHVLKDSAEIRRRIGGQLRLHRREAAVQTDSKIAVADG